MIICMLSVSLSLHLLSFYVVDVCLESAGCSGDTTILYLITLLSDSPLIYAVCHPDLIR